MDKNLSWKFLLIVGLVGLAAWTLYPPTKTLKPGIDLGGGTSLIYEINAKGLNAAEKRGLSERVITVLRRRIDPANIQNLVWRPQGNTRFEIQMPLSSAEARDKREKYEKALSTLLSKNVTPAAIMRSVTKPPEQRQQDFENFARDSNERMQILDEFANVYDQRNELQQQRDNLAKQMAVPENLIKQAGLNLDDIQSRVAQWAKLDEQKLKDALADYPGAEGNIDLLTRYTDMYRKWADVVDRLTDPENGVNIRFNEAIASLNKLNLSEDQVNFVLDVAKPGTAKRNQAIENLKKQFPERAELIDKVVDAYDTYYPYKGRLDDPADIQRMLKGAGILEFRILPTEGYPDVDMAKMARYVETLKTKGPKYASDNEYIWFEIENPKQFGARDSADRAAIIGQFGDKYYVLASNKKDECVLHSGQSKDWSLKRAAPGQDRQGRRAIDFQLDERGGLLFSRVTGKNIGRPLAILLDDMVISAPTVQSRIYTNGQITGNYSATAVADMVNKLNAGSLPARLIEQPISVKTIGPSIGADNRNRGIEAGLIGLAVVMVFMLAYYTLAGSIADVALLMNLLFILGIMAGLRATFTLPGIAGVILTIGMSVDANVLIFERIREEQLKGSSLAIAIKNGYERAFSAIFDSNLTTIMTAAILYWVASEEIKGFAITLMLGLASSLFTALFVTRTIFNWLLKRRIIKDHIVMLRLIHKPNINWMKYRPAFLVMSGILVIGGLTVFFTRNEAKDSKYDIEFTGGTSVQINLKDGVNLTRQQVEDKIHLQGEKMHNPGLAAATVYSVGKSGNQYEINTTETNITVATIEMPPNAPASADSVAAALRKAQTGKQAQLSNLVVSPDASNNRTFDIQTSQLNKQLVSDVLADAFPDANITGPQVNEVVTNAVLDAFQGQLDVQQSLKPEITSVDRITDSTIETHPELVDFVGGTVIRCKLERSALPAEIDQRFRNLRFKPEMREMSWYPYSILDGQLKPLDANEPVTDFAYVTAEPEAAFEDISTDTWMRFADNEKSKVLAAMELETSLPRVTQIDPSVGNEAKTRALVAIVLSLLAMLAYIAVRFGNLRFGLGAVVTLAHDTAATLGAVTACTYIAATAIGQYLLIGDFKIDLAMIAAFLTLLGYSINDTIVIYDRIRENRRKSTVLTPQIINNSINECMSRTLLTSLTTLFVIVVMYIFGGKGLRSFNFALMFGIIVGTYSSIAISAPILLLSTKRLTKKST